MKSLQPAGLVLLLLCGPPWLAGCGGTTGFAQGPRQRQPLGDGEALAFSHATVAGLPDLYLLDDEQGVRAIAQSEQYEFDPVWSPDGSTLLYQTSYGWSTQLRLMRADGTGPELLRDDDAYRFTVRWSPDGERIAYLGPEMAGDPSGQPIFLHVLNITSGEELKIAAAGIVDYAWLPETESIAAVFQAQDTAKVEEYRADGARVRQIAEIELPPGAGVLSLSPDGRWVAFVGPRQVSTSLTDPLYVTSIDGSETNRVGEFAVDSSVVWSPDSSRIALVTLDDEFNYVLHVATVDGRDQRQLMVLDTGDASGEILPGIPAWSSDGQALAISSFISPGGSAIFVVKADGTDLRQITEPHGLIFGLSWRPR